MKSFLKYLTLFLALAQPSFSQEPSKEKNWDFNFGIGLLDAEIKNYNYDEDQTLTGKTKNHIMIEVNASAKIGPTLYFTTGLNFKTFSASYQCHGAFKSNHTAVDIDGYIYYPYAVSDFAIDRSLSVIAIPTGLKLLAGTKNKTRLLVEFGLETSLALSYSEETNGTYEKKGLYPDAQYSNLYHLLENVPRLGYQNSSIKLTTDFVARTFLFNFYFAGGVLAPLSAKTDFYIKGYLTSGSGDITEEFQKEEYINVVGEEGHLNKTTVFGIGIITGILIR